MYIQDEQAHRSDAMLHTLQLLNHLATRDFLLDDEETSGEVSTAGMAMSFQGQVGEVLLAGLEMVVSQVSAELLRGFPGTTERYVLV